MAETGGSCPRCGFPVREDWSYCPRCALALPGAFEGRNAFSDRIHFVRSKPARRARRGVIIDSLANLSIGLSILLLVGGGILLFHPALVPSLFRPSPGIHFEPLPRVSKADVAMGVRGPVLPFEWIRIPAGEFRYGETGRTESVWVDEFFILKYEVTNSQWMEYLEHEETRLRKEGRFRESVPFTWAWDPRSGELPRPSDELWDRPVVSITWSQAKDFCVNYLAKRPGCEGARLPLAEEWEKAARGTEDDRPYPWGYEFYDRDVDNGRVLRCNDRETGLGRPTDVQDFPRDVSPYGVIGMAGNVSEWVGTIYNPGFRGGSYNDDAYDTRIYIPSQKPPNFRFKYVGFRAARSAPPKPGAGKAGGEGR